MNYFYINLLFLYNKLVSVNIKFKLLLLILSISVVYNYEIFNLTFS
jgi:hypothetical protein